jgi:hypothetical protein
MIFSFTFVNFTYIVIFRSRLNFLYLLSYHQATGPNFLGLTALISLMQVNAIVPECNKRLRLTDMSGIAYNISNGDTIQSSCQKQGQVIQTDR